MSDQKQNADDYERIMLETDGMIKKSQGFLLFVINQQGDFNAVAYPGELNSMTQLGLFTAAHRVIETAEDSIMSAYQYNGQTMGLPEDDEDDGEDDTLGGEKSE